MSLYIRIKASALEQTDKLTTCPKCNIPVNGKFCSECAQPLNITSVKTVPGLELLKEGDFMFPRNCKGYYACYVQSYDHDSIPVAHQDVIPHKRLQSMLDTLESHGITDYEVIFSH